MNPILTLAQFGPMKGDPGHQSYAQVMLDVRDVLYCVEGLLQMPFDAAALARAGYPRRDEAFYQTTTIYFENGQSVCVWGLKSQEVFQTKQELEVRYEIRPREDLLEGQSAAEMQALLDVSGPNRVHAALQDQNTPVLTIAKIAEIYRMNKLRNGDVEGRNFIEEGALHDGFVIFASGDKVGHAFDRKLNKTYLPGDVAKALGIPKEKYEGHLLAEQFAVDNYP